MSQGPKEFPRPPKKHQPRGLPILYEDRDILVVDKVSGLLTVSNEKTRDNTAYYRLTDYVRKGNRKSRHRIFIVHRLDKETSGVIVFAKSEDAKHFLQDQWGCFQKKYYTVVEGKLAKEEGIITSYLAENTAHKVFSVTNPKLGKLARTGYKVLRETDRFSLLEIDLLTGRKNQIRVHFADIGCPVAGDNKYGTKSPGAKRLALHSAAVQIVHPYSKEEMTFTTGIPTYFEALLRWKAKRSARPKKGTNRR